MPAASCKIVIISESIWGNKRCPMFGRVSPEMMFRRHGGLKWQVLIVLSSGPKRGMDIMDSIERAAWGFWRPSPGTIYPLLKTLLEDGLVSRRSNIYSLTAKGKEEIGLSPSSNGNTEASYIKVEKSLADLESYVDYLYDMKDDLKDRSEELRKIVKRLSVLSQEIGETKPGKKGKGVKP